MRSRTAEQVAAIVGGRVVGDGLATVDRIATDTRAALRAGDLFVALEGPHFDATEFATDAYAQGVRAALVSRDVDVPVGAAAVVVEDTLVALQALAAAERAAFGGIVVGITGSNGKTTVKDMLACALAPSVRVWASPMSYNSQVGVALSLLALDPDAAVAVVECGISRPGEMGRLEAMVRPDCGVFVTVSDAHLEGLGTRAVTAREKAVLFADLGSPGWCVVPEDESLARDALAAVGARVTPVSGSESVPMTGVLATDARLALAVAEALGYPLEAARAGLKTWTPAPMRLEISETPSGVVVINDAYTADPASAESALAVLVKDSGAKRRIAVLGGMAQLGEATCEANRALGARAHELGIDRLIGVGVGGGQIADGARCAGMPDERVHVADDVPEAGDLLARYARPGDRVLLKGARPERLERIAPKLFGALAPARAYIDLDGVVDNYRAIRARAGVPVMCVVKSFGYGLNARRIAAALEDAGAEAFCVAYADEGAELRAAGVAAPILVQNIVPGDVDKLVKFDLSAEVGHPSQLAAIRAGGHSTPISVHLKVDTGMSRAGVKPSAALSLARALDMAPEVDVVGLMTHFASADEPEQDDFTREQIGLFTEVVGQLRAASVSPRWIHAANTAGALRFPEARFTMVRAGIGLLGYGPRTPEVAARPVLRLATRVIATKVLEAGDAVGYGRTHVVSTPTVAAMVAVGYGDGYPRALSNLGWMAIDGIRCPVIGRVCMDVTMIDVSAVPREVGSGDEVIVYGPASGEPDLAALATVAGTIPYELLTRLTGRIRRIYSSER